MRGGCLAVACLALGMAPARAELPFAPVFWVPVMVPAWGQVWAMVPPPAAYGPVFFTWPVVTSSAQTLPGPAPAPDSAHDPARLGTPPAVAEVVVPPMPGMAATEAKPETPVGAPVKRVKPKRKAAAKVLPKPAAQLRKLCWRDHELKPCP